MACGGGGCRPWCSPAQARLTRGRHLSLSPGAAVSQISLSIFTQRWFSIHPSTDIRMREILTGNVTICSQYGGETFILTSALWSNKSLYCILMISAGPGTILTTHSPSLIKDRLMFVLTIQLSTIKLNIISKAVLYIAMQYKFASKALYDEFKDRWTI